MGYHLEHSDATHAAPSITDATYTVMRELRDFQALGIELRSLLNVDTAFPPPKTLSYDRQ